MASYFFNQQAQGWQQMFRRSQSGGFFSRLLAWLVLGLALMIGMVVVVSVLLLSWLLIPVLLFKKRKAAKARQFHHGDPYGKRSSQGDVIEGVVVEVKDSK
tara:strand:+ start:173277 stop:173579 length:303 start_codon:yes stop_codon:yes gene_type:complete